jgi:hypothetical protein
MKKIKDQLIEKELEFFTKKPLEFCLELKDLSLSRTSNHPLIHHLKILIKKNLEFLTDISVYKISNLTSELMEKLEKIYEEFTVVFINFFDDKARITKKTKTKESYEKIMSYLVSIFYKFEII